jgi:ABC-type Zn uptake system ZnuABC Zn-binding protein ZnuA
MKKIIFPLIAILFICAVAVAQVINKKTSNDAMAPATKTVTLKPGGNTANAVAPLKTTVAGKAPIRRKPHRHHSHKVMAKRM